MTPNADNQVIISMFDAEIGLDKGDSISLKLDGGALYVWNNNGRVSVSVSVEGSDIMQMYIDDATCVVEAVTSPQDRVAVPVKSWEEVLRMCGK